MNTAHYVTFPTLSFASRLRRYRKIQFGHWQFQRFLETQRYVRAWATNNQTTMIINRRLNVKISDFDISTLAKILANACSSRTSYLCPMSNRTGESNCPFEDYHCMEIRTADWIEVLNKED